MALIAAFVLGAGYGVFSAHRAGLPTADKVHRALVYGIALVLLVLVFSVVRSYIIA